MEPGNNQKCFFTPIHSQIFIRPSEDSSDSIELPTAKSIFELFTFIKQELSSQTAQIIERLPDPDLKVKIDYLTESIKSQSESIQAHTESIKANTESIRSLEQSQNRDCLNCKEYQAFLLENMKNRDSIISNNMTEETDLIEKPKLIYIAPESSESEIDLIGSTTERKNFLVSGRSSVVSDFSFQRTTKPDSQVISGISNQFLKELNKKNREIEELKVTIDQISNENSKMREKFEDVKKFYSGKVREMAEQNRSMLKSTEKLISNIELNSKDITGNYKPGSSLCISPKVASKKFQEEIKGEKFKLKKLNEKNEKKDNFLFGLKPLNKEEETITIKPAEKVGMHPIGLKPLEKTDKPQLILDPYTKSEKPSLELNPIDKSDTCPSRFTPNKNTEKIPPEPSPINPETEKKLEHDLKKSESNPYDAQPSFPSPSKCVKFSKTSINLNN